jgi:outer membrane protein assembly factor BamB
VVNPNTGNTVVLCLDKEEIQNSFAIDRNGAYIVSDHALYGILIDTVTDQPSMAWRETYERASLKKTGSLTLGSGTTPTLLGEKYVAITDNADPQIHILVYRREMDFSGQRLICKVPVFEAGKSATDNSLIGVGNSLIVENNYGYDLFTNMQFGRTGAGGITRVDFSEKTGKAEVVWSNPTISQTTVPKISLANGLVYVYAKDSSVGRGIDAFYLTAIDFETGETKFEILTGTGVSYDNNWAPITLGTDNSAYIGVLRGLVKVFDGRIP